MGPGYGMDSERRQYREGETSPVQTSARHADDPWQHRSEQMKCRTCMWFVAKAELPPRVSEADKLGMYPRIIGRCRRHSPSMSGFPVVWATDWCGDHKLDEDKAG